MKLHLSDLDELVSKVINTESKKYLNEAVVSYRAGAYRSVLITTWIAVCVDIINKIRELSVEGDPVAKAIEDRLDAIQPDDTLAMMNFEKELLDFACDDLEFISVIEKSYLNKLKEDRNICAHPTFSVDGSQFTPIAETALSYIVGVANYLLIHPPVKGKVMVKRLFDLINEDSFPEDAEKAFVVLSSKNNLGRVRDSSVRNLVIILLKRLFLDDEKIKLRLLNCISAAMVAISRICPEIYREVIDSKFTQMLSDANDKRLKRVLPFILYRPQEWSSIEQSERVRIEGLLPLMSVEAFIKFKVVKVSETISSLQSGMLEKVDDFDALETSTLLSSIASPLLIEQAIELFNDSKSFDSAEYRGRSIVMPLSEYLTSEHIEKILKGSCENKGAHGYNQILHAGGIESFFQQLYQKTKDNNQDHEAQWVKFRNTIQDKNFSYPGLDLLMIEDNLIEEDEEQEEQSHDSENIPF